MNQNTEHYYTRKPSVHAEVAAADFMAWIASSGLNNGDTPLVAAAIELRRRLAQEFDRFADEEIAGTLV